MKEFNATLDVKITHRAGPVIDDPAHVLAWTCADGNLFEGWDCAFRFDVCSTHTDPDECDYVCDRTPSTYQALIMSATPEEPDPPTQH